MFRVTEKANVNFSVQNLYCCLQLCVFVAGCLGQASLEKDSVGPTWLTKGLNKYIINRVLRGNYCDIIMMFFNYLKRLSLVL